MAAYDFASVETKWAKKWLEDGIYIATEDPQKTKYYPVGMLPYPSGKLHMGHVLVYSLVDSKARLRRMQGYSVLNPIGWDAFGLPAENAAIQHGIHPATWTHQNIENGREQLQRLGYSFDWSREISSCEPEYYRWTQWLFLFMLKNGIAERRAGWVNWCPTDNTVLANEQVEADGTCWRCGTKVSRKKLTQWFFKIREFAEELWQGLDDLGSWPGPALAVQRNWIGKSEGMEINFSIPEKNISIPVFTTRPDTIYGATFLVLAPEHELTADIVMSAPDSGIARYVEEALSKNELDRLQQDEKTGVKTDLIAENPLTGEHIPIWISDYVLPEYGTGAVMGVPAHDERDMQFAVKYGLPIRQVISSADSPNSGPITVYTGDGIMVNSGEFTGEPKAVAIDKIREKLISLGLGKPAVRYKLRDWLISRQRYWGCPIPVVYCDTCGIVPVPEDQLPVLLPQDVQFVGISGNPLETSNSFLNATCPNCGGPARRETDTMDTFMCSSWYVFRYLDPHNDAEPFSMLKTKYWLPLDYYVGLLEHAGCHMIYFRFFVKMLHKHGLLPVSEPVYNFFNNGIVKMGGSKMSKSKGNVVSPEDAVREYGADVLRFYILSDSPPDQDMEWNTKSTNGISRYVQSLWRTFQRVKGQVQYPSAVDLAGANWSEEEKALRGLLHRTIRKVEQDVMSDHHNTAISAIRILSNAWQDYANGLDLEKLKNRDRLLLSELTVNLILLLAPLMNFLSEEMWSQLGNKDSVHVQRWPQYDPKLLEAATVELVVQINSRKRKVISVPADATRRQVEEMIQEDSEIQKALRNRALQRTIYVPKKLINYVCD